MGSFENARVSVEESNSRLRKTWVFHVLVGEDGVRLKLDLYKFLVLPWRHKYWKVKGWYERLATDSRTPAADVPLPPEVIEVARKTLMDALVIQR